MRAGTQRRERVHARCDVVEQVHCAMIEIMGLLALQGLL